MTAVEQGSGIDHREHVLAWLASALSAVLTARLILNMREVVDTDSMDIASVEASTVEWNDIDGIPMEDTRAICGIGPRGVMVITLND
ncbi:hypothetical protein B0H13DRAFT_2322043 [Mycena leptocephala]|nr:hypothetical protein B0H13DRAFT_2322043 [Mycena leptocephala]